MPAAVAVAVAMSGFAPQLAVAAEVATVAAAPSLACVDAQENVTQAQAMARQCGRSVEVMSKRTETDRVLANPSGTFSLERALAPQRVRQGNGQWAAIDTTLRREPDGSVVPTSTPRTMRFSGGGSGSFAEMRLDDGSLALSWPGSLPDPRLEGDSAVYANVLPGVDLRIRALSTGFTFVLVVNTRAAAANPGLRELRLGFTGHGVTLRNRPGGVEAVGGNGKVLFAGTGAAMWDSATKPPAPALSARSNSAMSNAERAELAAESALQRGRSGAPMVSTAVEPGELATRAAVGARTTGKHLVLTPDQAMLTSPDTVFPLFIDPPMAFLAWAYANTWNYNNMTWGDVWAGVNPADGQLYRGYFIFDTTPLIGKQILSASFSVVMRHSWSCGATATTLVRTTNPIDYLTPWAPGLLQWVDVPKWGNAHKISGGVPVCNPDPQPDMWLTWGGDLAAQLAAYSYIGNMTLSVMAGSYGGDEWAQGNWKKFYATTATLNVEYNAPPSVAGPATVPAMPCVVGDTRPHVSSLPQLQIQVNDPEGGNGQARFEWWTTGGSLIAASGVTSPAASGSIHTTSIPAQDLADGGTYSWRAQGSDGAIWGDFGPWCEFTLDSQAPSAAATTPISYCQSTATAGDTASLPRLNPNAPGLNLKAVVKDVNGGTTQAQFEWWRKADRHATGTSPLGSLTTSPPASVGSTFQTNVAAATFANGQAYSWRARGHDGGFVKPWTPWCEFVVDTVAPATPTMIAGPGNDLGIVAAPTVPPAPSATAVVGRPSRITFKPNGGVADANIAGYFWSVSEGGGSPTTWAPADSSGNAVVSIEPVAGGFAVNKVTVLAVDKAGNRSALPGSGYSFGFKAKPAKGWWKTTGTGGPIEDGTPNDNDLTLSPAGASLVQGAMVLNGTTGYATSAAPVLDTTSSFTLSAWARPVSLTGDRTVLSQDGVAGSGPRLQYNAASNAWCFSMPTSDTAGAPVVKSCAATAPRRQTWAHLAAVYNAGAGTISLFVDGTQVDSDPFATAWSADGPLAVGRGLVGGAAGEFFAGDIADVKAWDSVLDPAGITALAKLPPAAGRWTMDDPSATAASDQSGLAATQNATLSTGGSGWASGGHKGFALALDGVSGKANTSTARVGTNVSFSVSAWVYTTETSTASIRTALTQKSSTRGGYFLQQRNGFWAFGRPTSSTSSTIVWATSTAAVVPNSWVHLVGVYDSTAAQIKLLVNGTVVATTACSCAWNATGAMTFGQTQWPQPDLEWWKGRLDDVRVFRGALSDAQIAYLTTQ